MLYIWLQVSNMFASAQPCWRPVQTFQEFQPTVAMRMDTVQRAT